jgi:hypothetical protein
MWDKVRGFLAGISMSMIPTLYSPEYLGSFPYRGTLVPQACLEAVPWASCPSLPAHHSYDPLLRDGQGRILERLMKETCEMLGWMRPQMYNRDMLVVYSRANEKFNVL